jgi:predicted enzyme related to lactoylglutathione lyase
VDVVHIDWREAIMQFTQAFAGMSSDDIEASGAFYRDVLGLEVTEEGMGILTVHLPGGGRAIIYPKNDHQPATFTVLNFAVDDIDAAVDELRERGVDTKIYPDEVFPSDERGIVRGGGGGPDIAWFRDPAGNVIAVLQA